MLSYISSSLSLQLLQWLLVLVSVVAMTGCPGKVHEEC